MHLLILGGNGGVGNEIAKQAHARGHKVTVLVRSDGEFPAGVTIVKGSPADDVLLASVLSGQDAVLSGLGHNMSSMLPWKKENPTTTSPSCTRSTSSPLCAMPA